MFVFPYEDEEAMLDALMEADVDVQDLSVEDGMMTVKTAFTDFGKGQEAIENFVNGVEFETCEATLLPDEYVTLTNQEDIDAYHKLIDLLDEADDVNKVYTNVIIEGE